MLLDSLAPVLALLSSQNQPTNITDFWSSYPYHLGFHKKKIHLTSGQTSSPNLRQICIPATKKSVSLILQNGPAESEKRSCLVAKTNSSEEKASTFPKTVDEKIMVTNVERDKDLATSVSWYKCDLCDRWFPSKQDLCNHNFMMHDKKVDLERTVEVIVEKVQATNVSWYLCNLCEWSAISEKGLYLHYALEHKKKVDFVKTVVQEQVQENRATNMFKCSLCNFGCSSKTDLDNHKERLHATYLRKLAQKEIQASHKASASKRKQAGVDASLKSPKIDDGSGTTGKEINVAAKNQITMNTTWLMHKCEFCYFTTLSMEGLKIHQRWKHKEEIQKGKPAGAK